MMQLPLVETVLVPLVEALLAPLVLVLLQLPLVNSVSTTG